MLEAEIRKARFIAYFDVLGYSAFLKESSDDEGFYQSIRRVIGFAHEVEKQPEGYVTKTFSDNVVIVPTVDNEEDSLRQLNHLISYMAFAHLMLLADEDLLMRGSIVHDDILVDDDVVFGRGIVTAHEAEGLARHPRTVVHESVFNELGEDADQLIFVEEDADGMKYVDYFGAIDFMPINSEAAFDGQDAKTMFISRIRDNLRERVKKYCRYAGNARKPDTIAAREGVIAKHYWVVTKFNRYCNSRDLGEYAVKFDIRMNERLMKPELVLVDGGHSAA